MDIKIYLYAYIIVISFLLVTIILQWPDDRLHIVQCDVGQGDATLIYRGFAQILIDGGKDNKVLECLDKYIPLWDKKLDLMIATHDDHDHIGGFSSVLASYNIEKIVYNGKVSQSNDWQSVLGLAQNQNTQIIPVDLNVYKLNGIDITFIWPNSELVNELEDNSASVVSRLQYGSFSGIFTGDIDNLTEEKIIKDVVTLSSSILKVSHHGSRFATSDIWLEKINPELALIGVGKNSYGHPHPDILQRLADYNIKTKRTDQDGNIEIVSDGQSWWLEREHNLFVHNN